MFDLVIENESYFISVTCFWPSRWVSHFPPQWVATHRAKVGKWAAVKIWPLSQLPIMAQVKKAFIQKQKMDFSLTPELKVLLQHDVHQTALFRNEGLNLTSDLSSVNTAEMTGLEGMRSNNCLGNTSEWFTSALITTYFPPSPVLRYWKQ